MKEFCKLTLPCQEVRKNPHILGEKFWSWLFIQVCGYMLIEKADLRQSLFFVILFFYILFVAIKCPWHRWESTFADRKKKESEITSELHNKTLKVIWAVDYLMGKQCYFFSRVLFSVIIFYFFSLSTLYFWPPKERCRPVHHLHPPKSVLWYLVRI